MGAFGWCANAGRALLSLPHRSTGNKELLQLDPECTPVVVKPLTGIDMRLKVVGVAVPVTCCSRPGM